MKNITLGIVLIIAFSVVFQLAQDLSRGPKYAVVGLSGTILAFGVLSLAKAARERRGDR